LEPQGYFLYYCIITEFLRSKGLTISLLDKGDELVIPPSFLFKFLIMSLKIGET